MKAATKPSESSTVSSNTEDRASKLRALQTNNIYFQNAVRYVTYRLPDKSQILDERLAARTGKYPKRMVTLMNAYKFDDKDLITVLNFLAQFEKACVSRGDLEGTIVWRLPTFMKDAPESSLTFRATFAKMKEAPIDCRKQRKSRSLHT